MILVSLFITRFNLFKLSLFIFDLISISVISFLRFIKPLISKLAFSSEQIILPLNNFSFISPVILIFLYK